MKSMRVVAIFILMFIGFNTLPFSALLEHVHVDSKEGSLILAQQDDGCADEENCNCPCSTQEGGSCKSCGVGNCMVALLSTASMVPSFQGKLTPEVSALTMDSIISSPITPPPKV